MTSDTITWFDTVRATHTPDSGPVHGDPSIGSLN